MAQDLVGELGVGGPAMGCRRCLMLLDKAMSSTNREKNNLSVVPTPGPGMKEDGAQGRKKKN